MDMPTGYTRRRVLGALAAFGAATALTPLMAHGAAVRTLDLDVPTMGTRFRLAVAGGADAWLRVDLPRLKRDVLDILADAEADFSPFRTDSALARFNAARTTAPQVVPANFARVLETAQTVRAQTQGAFDPAVGRLVEGWGFWGAPRRFATDVRLGVSLGGVEIEGARVRKSAPDLAVDLCAIAKGDALDRVCARVREAGLDNFMAEIGGEIKAFDSGPDGLGWRIGVENPAGGLFARVHLDGQAIATSGDYVKFFTNAGKRFGHILDPHTGRPAESDLALVSVVADQSWAADAMATALYAMGGVHGPAFARAQNIPTLFAHRMSGGVQVETTHGFGERGFGGRAT